MHDNDLTTQGANMMRICNACRYCEGYCAVWRAMEFRRAFSPGDLSYLANLCHDCHDCYYACQYAPPHEFAVNPPLTFARIRQQSYERFAWPGALAGLFRESGLAATLVVVVALVLLALGVAHSRGAQALVTAVAGGDFYQLTSHGFLVAAFGAAGLFSLLALTVGLVRFCRHMGERLLDLLRPETLGVAVKEALRLEYLDGDGWGCAYPGDKGSQLRRWFHHLTFYGFLLCFAATAVAAIYDYVFHWPAPYATTSLPVILGTLGGLGLLVGPAGLLVLRQRRNPETSDKTQSGMDTALLVLLFLTSASGLLLLALRETPLMGALLLVHLAFVMGFFLTVPYGKFVHGIYRFLALAKYALERKRKQILGA